MATVAAIQSNFNGGELSPTVEGRVDINKYSNGLYRMRGFIPLVQGPARRRSGTRFVAEAKDSTVRGWLVPFTFSDDSAFVLELGDNMMRFYTDHGQLIVTVFAPYSAVTTYTPGEVVNVAGQAYVCILESFGNAPAVSPLYWYPLTMVGGNAIYEIPTPWAEADLTKPDGTFKLWMEQSGDVIYITHPSYPPQKLIRLENTSWSLTAVEFQNGPFIGVNPDETITVYASAETGTGITLTASSGIFDAAQIGSLMLIETKLADQIPQWEPGKVIALGVQRRSDGNYYLSTAAGTTGGSKPVHLQGARYDGDPGVQWEYLHSGYGIVRITAVASSVSATADVVSRIPIQAVGVGNPTTRWSFAEFSDQRGYPSHVSFFRERLFLFRSTQAWGSVASDFENFANRDGADVTADMAISINFASDQINDVAWVMPGNQLLVGTVGNEFAIGELSTSDPLGPANIQATPQTSHGSRQVRPIRVNDSILFAQKSGRKLREIRFSFESEGYATTDLTVLADHITKGQIVQLAYQQEPHSIVWCACANGDLIGFTFNREQDVLGWHAHQLGGTTEAVVESVVCIPSPDGARDELWLQVRRNINGVIKRHIEYMERDFISSEGMTLDDAFFVDSGLTYEGPPASVFSGLDHLEGQLVTGLAADGVLMGLALVSAGSVTFPDTPPGGFVAPCSIGLPYPANMTTMRIETGSDIGTAQGKIKRITDVRVRLLDTVGGVAGRDGATLDAIKPDPDAAAGLYSDDSLRVTWPQGYELAGRMTIQQNDPLPMTIVALMPTVATTG